jgi:hypothetical protein
VSYYLGFEGSGGNQLIGVYSTKQDAEHAIRRLQAQPGFRDFPEGFEICEYPINKDHWTEGFVTV